MQASPQTLLLMLADGRFWQAGLDMVTIFLAINLALKCVTIVRSLRWSFSLNAKQLEKFSSLFPDESTFYAELEASHGGFLPFGLKEFRIRRLANRLKARPGAMARALYWPIHAFQWATRFQHMIPILALYLLAASSLLQHATPADALLPLAWHRLLLILMALAANLLLYFEAIVCFALFGGYARPYHQIDTHRHQRKENALLVELKMLSIKIALTLLCGATAAYVTTLFSGAMQGTIHPFPAAIESLLQGLELFGQLLYWCITTFTTVGFGDIVPTNGLGQLITVLVEAQSFLVLAFVLTSIFTKASSQKD